MTRPVLLLLGVLGLAAVLLAYLRDPAWLADSTSGLSRWMTDEHGTRYRWTGGHVSFFVPAERVRVDMPLRATFDSPSDWPIAVTVTIDDRLVERVTLDDDRWRVVTVRVPPPGSRRFRRIDLVLDRMREEGRGIQLGEVTSR